MLNAAAQHIATYMIMYKGQERAGRGSLSWRKHALLSHLQLLMSQISLSDKHRISCIYSFNIAVLDDGTSALSMLTIGTLKSVARLITSSRQRLLDILPSITLPEIILLIMWLLAAAASVS